MPHDKLKKLIWIAVPVFFLLILPLVWFVAPYPYRVAQEDWIERNRQKVKLGMSYEEVKSLLGYPSIVLYASYQDLKQFHQTSAGNNFFVKFFDLETVVSNQRDTQPGEIGWLYYYYPDPGLYSPTYIFDVSTGRVIRITRSTSSESD